jgi:hypothetical protein
MDFFTHGALECMLTLEMAVDMVPWFVRSVSDMGDRDMSKAKSSGRRFRLLLKLHMEAQFQR